MDIKEQIKELKIGAEVCKSLEKHYTTRLLSEAADTIEKLYTSKKPELRPCIVTITQEEDKPLERKTEQEKRKAYFHAWAGNKGIVEYEDGTVHKVVPESITFTGRVASPD